MSRPDPPKPNQLSFLFILATFFFLLLLDPLKKRNRKPGIVNTKRGGRQKREVRVCAPPSYTPTSFVIPAIVVSVSADAGTFRL